MTGDRKSRRIIVIDDDDLIRQTLENALGPAGFEVATAADGIEGLRLVAERRPDIVITDILMPNKEGIETIMELRRIDPEVMIIAISGGGRARNTSFLDLAKKLGADAVLEKPFDIGALRNTVDACLKKAGTKG